MVREGREGARAELGSAGRDAGCPRDRFLRRLVRYGGRKIFLILDSHSVHKAAASRKWLERHRSKGEVFLLSRGQSWSNGPRSGSEESRQGRSQGGNKGRTRARRTPPPPPPSPTSAGVWTRIDLVNAPSAGCVSRRSTVCGLPEREGKPPGGVEMTEREIRRRYRVDFPRWRYRRETKKRPLEPPARASSPSSTAAPCLATVGFRVAA